MQPGSSPRNFIRASALLPAPVRCPRSRRYLALGAFPLLPLLALTAACGRSSPPQAPQAPQAPPPAQAQKATEAQKAPEVSGPLILHVGGTMRPALSEIASRYEKQTGAKVEINAADSGQLLAHIEGHREGDVYVAHDPFMDFLMARGLGDEAWTVAALTPVIVVRKGNPKGVRDVVDLTRQDLALALTDYQYSTLGHMLPLIFKKAGVDFDRFKAQPNIQNFRQGSQAANVVVTGNADAAIVWNAVAFLRRHDLEAIPIAGKLLPLAGVDAVTSATGKRYDMGLIRVTIATLSCSRQPEAARRFAQFVASPEAAAVFLDSGFTSAPVRKEYEKGKRIPQ